MAVVGLGIRLGFLRSALRLARRLVLLSALLPNALAARSEVGLEALPSVLRSIPLEVLLVLILRWVILLAAALRVVLEDFLEVVLAVVLEACLEAFLGVVLRAVLEGDLELFLGFVLAVVLEACLGVALEGLLEAFLEAVLEVPREVLLEGDLGLFLGFVLAVAPEAAQVVIPAAIFLPLATGLPSNLAPLEPVLALLLVEGEEGGGGVKRGKLVAFAAFLLLYFVSLSSRPSFYSSPSWQEMLSERKKYQNFHLNFQRVSNYFEDEGRVLFQKGEGKGKGEYKCQVLEADGEYSIAVVDYCQTEIPRLVE